MHEAAIAILENEAEQLEAKLASVRKTIAELRGKSALKGAGSKQPPSGSLIGTSSSGQIGEALRMIQEAVDSFAGPFSLPDVAAFLDVKYPDHGLDAKTISTKLSKMKSLKTPKIRVVRQGSGTIPTTYSRVI